MLHVHFVLWWNQIHHVQCFPSDRVLKTTILVSHACFHGFPESKQKIRSKRRVLSSHFRELVLVASEVSCNGRFGQTLSYWMSWPQMACGFDIFPFNPISVVCRYLTLEVELDCR